MPRQSAESCLLFSGRADETGEIVTLRLGLVRDGEVRVMQISAERL